MRLLFPLYRRRAIFLGFRIRELSMPFPKCARQLPVRYHTPLNFGICRCMITGPTRIGNGGGGKWRYPEYWRSPRNVRNPMRYVSIRYRFMPLFIIFVHYAIRYHAILYYWRAGYSVSWRKLAADMLEFRSWGYLMSFWALALSFLFCGCFVSPCWPPLGVGRAARAVVSFVQIVVRRLALVVIRKKKMT